MKKTRVPASIDKEIHQRIKLLQKFQPELGYKTISKFVNETLEKELEKLENKRIFKRMKESGIENVFDLVHKTHKDITKVLEDTEKRDKKDAKFEADLIEMKKKIDILVELRDEILKRKLVKRKHTHRVYKPKKK